MGKGKRVVPYALLSSEVALTDNTATAVTDANSVAISGCYVSFIAMHTGTTVAADAYFKILSDSTTLISINLSGTANVFEGNVVSFPFPIKVDGALKIQQSGTCTVTYRVGYIEM